MSSQKINITNTADGLKLASCYVGARINEDFCLVGLNREFFTIFSQDMVYAHATQIPLDLSTFQPCIYQCMKQGLKVEVEFNNKMSAKYDFSKPEDKIVFVDDMYCMGGIKSIKILGLEDMEGLITEGGEG
jgi:hypothetical protein